MLDSILGSGKNYRCPKGMSRIAWDSMSEDGKRAYLSSLKKRVSKRKKTVALAKEIVKQMRSKSTYSKKTSRKSRRRYY